MTEWLEDNRRQYRIFLDVAELLLDRGFAPLSTAPVSGVEFRTDHTRAVVEALRSLRADAASAPTRVFSTGPLFRFDSLWADAIDVEWVGEITEAHEAEAVTMAAEVAKRLSRPGFADGQLTMVFGHAGWLFQLLNALDLAENDSTALVAALRHGRLAEAERILGRQFPDALPLFRAQDQAPFFSHLNQFIPAVPVSCQSAPWRTLWDLSLIGRQGYYTGLVFCLYHGPSALPILTGGRFAIEGQASSSGIGFTLDLESCRSASGAMSHAG